MYYNGIKEIEYLEFLLCTIKLDFVELKTLFFPLANFPVSSLCGGNYSALQR